MERRRRYECSGTEVYWWVWTHLHPEGWIMIELLSEPVGVMLMAMAIGWYTVRYGGLPTTGKQA